MEHKVELTFRSLASGMRVIQFIHQSAFEHDYNLKIVCLALGKDADISSLTLCLFFYNSAEKGVLVYLEYFE